MGTRPIYYQETSRQLPRSMPSSVNWPHPLRTRRLKLDGYGKVSAAAKYAGVSVRTFREWLKDHRLRRVVMPTGTVLIRFSWVDDYLGLFESKPDNVVDKIVGEVMKDFA
jgi:excisionase family DNA binding protein